MKIFAVLGTWVTLLCMGIAQAGPHFSQPESGMLRAAVGFAKDANAYFVDVTNRSDDFLCVDQDAFDTARGGIALSDKDGRPVRLRSYADASPDIVLGFDFSKAYVFLPPQTTRRVWINWNNFIVHRGEYSYRLVFSFYRCRDVIDLGRKRTQRNIPGYSVSAHGEIYAH